MAVNPTSHIFAYGGASASHPFLLNFGRKVAPDDTKLFLLAMKTTELAGVFVIWQDDITSLATLSLMNLSPVTYLLIVVSL
jgi:hypothetical protein